MSANLAPGLEKPAWLRLTGWLSLVLVMVPLCIPLVEVISHYRIPRTVWPGFCLLAFFPSFAVWVIGSLGHRFTVYRAKVQAAALMAAARKAPPTSASGGGR